MIEKSKREVSPLRIRSVNLQFPWHGFIALALLMFAVVSALPAFAASGQFIAHNTPAYVSTAKNLGTEDASKTIEVSIWLQPHNRSGLDALARDLYNPNSPNYRHWLKTSDIAARFAPSAAEVKTVQDFLESHDLKTVRVGPNNFYVRARGTVASVQNAFHVQLNHYQVGKKVIRANASDPYVEGPAAALVQSISGLDDAQLEHPMDLRPVVPTIGQTKEQDRAQAAKAQDAGLFQSVCFPGQETETVNTYGSYPIATYTGNEYYSTSPGCGYSPSNVYGAYNLNGLYSEGFNGAGQTIAIIDWCGSTTILSDANKFSKQFGLPKLTSSNFQIIQVPTQSQCAGVDLEVNLDVEWAHAIAPGANLDLVVPPTAYFQDIDEAWFYIINYGLSNVISGSFSAPEFFVATSELEKENLIAEIGAVSGIASNFSSGDAADYGTEHIPPTVSVPADVPYATGIGGVSLALNADNSIAFQTGWESQVSILDNSGVINDPCSPLNFYGFDGGSGGGPSAYFSKPAFQKPLLGKFRRVPDISWLADPFTGAAVLISEPDQVPAQVWYVVGGTSLSTPMFSALWAIANEEAGSALGQAAPYLYTMPSTTITDIVPYVPGGNVTAAIQQSSTKTQHFSQQQTLCVIEPLFGKFYSALWDYADAQDTVLAVSFGQYYHLKVTPGWDNVTGLGTPNAQAFADWFAPAKK